MPTHREKLQEAILKLQEIYDLAGSLRDHSTLEMQREYNNVRRELPNIWGYLQKIENNLLSDSHAEQEL